MNKPDAGLRNTLRKGLAPLGFEVTPIESGSTSAGICDLYWRHRDHQKRGWIECKITKGWKVELRPHQCGFILREVMAGGSACIAIWAQGAGSGGADRSALWLIAGAAAMRLIGPEGLRGLNPEDVLARLQGPPRKWDYGVIASCLTSPRPLENHYFDTSSRPAENAA